MEKVVNAKMWIEDAVTVNAYYKDFDGDVSQWKDSFYEIWRHQMTWDFAHKIRVHEQGKTVCIEIVFKKAYRKNVLDMMDSLGYRNVKVEDVKIGTVPLYDINDPVAEDVFEVFAEW